MRWMAPLVMFHIHWRNQWICLFLSQQEERIICLFSPSLSSIWLSLPSSSSIREPINITPDTFTTTLRDYLRHFLKSFIYTLFVCYIHNDWKKRRVINIWLTTVTTKDGISIFKQFQGKSLPDSIAGSCEKIWLDIFGAHTFIYELDNYIYIVKDVFVISEGK